MMNSQAKSIKLIQELSEPASVVGGVGISQERSVSADVSASQEEFIDYAMCCGSQSGRRN